MEVTLTPRSIGLIVAAAMAAGWIGASALQEPAPAQTRVPTGPRPLGTRVSVPRAERLRERIPAAPQPNLGRNPFVYGARVPSRRASAADRVEMPAAAPAPPVAPDAPVVPVAPVIRLSGIASNVETGATILTAILNDNGSLVFAKVGDRLSNGMSVAKIDEMSVTLTDSAGQTQTLRLP